MEEDLTDAIPRKPCKGGGTYQLPTRECGKSGGRGEGRGAAEEFLHCFHMLTLLAASIPTTTSCHHELCNFLDNDVLLCVQCSTSTALYTARNEY